MSKVANLAQAINNDYTPTERLRRSNKYCILYLLCWLQKLAVTESKLFTDWLYTAHMNKIIKNKQNKRTHTHTIN